MFLTQTHLGLQALFFDSHSGENRVDDGRVFLREYARLFLTRHPLFSMHGSYFIDGRNLWLQVKIICLKKCDISFFYVILQTFV